MNVPCPKTPHLRSSAWKAMVRKMPCVFRGTFPSEAAHISWNSGKGMAYKAADNRIVPLSSELHHLQGTMSETKFWHDNIRKNPRFYDQCAKAWGEAFARGEFTDIALPEDEHTVEMVVAWAEKQHRHFLKTGRALWQ